MGTVNSCCCCTLAQGTVGAGIYSVIESVVTLVRGGELLRKLKELKEDYAINDYSGIVEKYDQNQLKSVYRAYGWGYVIIGAIYLLLSVMIFVAVATRRRGYLVPWLVCTSISFVLLIIGLFFNLSSGLIDPVVFARIIIELVIMGYLYIVVYSYYNSLQHPSVYPTSATANTQTRFTQPGFVIQASPSATPFSTVSENFKSQPPAYPEAVSNSAPVANNAPYAAAYSNFPPPPSYSEAVKTGNQ